MCKGGWRSGRPNGDVEADQEPTEGWKTSNQRDGTVLIVGSSGVHSGFCGFRSTDGKMRLVSRSSAGL